MQRWFEQKKVGYLIWHWPFNAYAAQSVLGFNPNKSDIGEKTPTFVQDDITPW